MAPKRGEKRPASAKLEDVLSEFQEKERRGRRLVPTRSWDV